MIALWLFQSGAFKHDTQKNNNIKFEHENRESRRKNIFSCNKFLILKETKNVKRLIL